MLLEKNKEKWNELCFILSENINQNGNESIFEHNIIQALQVLGWKQYLGEIEIRPSIQIGAANRLTPDFVIKSSDNIKLFVIEIKHPKNPLTTRHQQQLFSYMRQLKLEFGVLIGNEIQIFYEGNVNDSIDPILLITIPFHCDLENGEDFVRLFSKESFNRSLLNEFAKICLDKNKKQQHLIEIKNIILSEEYNTTLKHLIQQNLSPQYNTKNIEEALKNIKISITDKSESIIKKNAFIQQDKIFSPKNNFSTSNNKMKIGEYVRTTFYDLIKNKKLRPSEVENLQKADYSKLTFDIQFPFLKKRFNPNDELRIRYWKKPFIINGETFYVCSQWYEVPANNDRPYYENWLKTMRNN